jgi:hypothetical protein
MQHMQGSRDQRLRCSAKAVPSGPVRNSIIIESSVTPLATSQRDSGGGMMPPSVGHLCRDHEVDGRADDVSVHVVSSVDDETGSS